MKKTLIEMLIASGYPEKDIFHHGADLYFFRTPETEKTLKAWITSNGWNAGLINGHFLIDVFRDNITGKLMYDVFMQYYDFKKDGATYEI